MRFLTCQEDVETERKIAIGSLIRSLREGMESVSFTGRLMLHGGEWCGIYGTPGDLKLRTSGGVFFRLEEA